MSEAFRTSREGLHWTYEQISETEIGLRQGDILQPTEDLRRLLAKVEPLNDKRWLAYIITTQDCDLVCREGKCDTAFVNIAGVISLATALPELLGAVCQQLPICKVPRIYPQEKKNEAAHFVKKILNQNAWKEGLFYLQSDAGVQLGEPAVALLRLSCSLRLDEAVYEVCQKARTGRLCGLFRAKLGWTVGNLFSRVGTPDWGELNKGDNETMRTIVNDQLDSLSSLWIPKSWAKAATMAKAEVDGLSCDEVRQILERHKPQPHYLSVVKRVLQIAKSSIPTASSSELADFEQRLVEDVIIKNIKSKAEIKGE